MILKDGPAGRSCHLILVLCLVLLAGCGDPSQSYHNPKFGYTVEMPEDWIVEEEPWFSSQPGRENTVRFRAPLLNPSWDEAINVDSVEVNAIEGKEPWQAMGDSGFGLSRAEYKVGEWRVGDMDGYYVESRFHSGYVNLGWSDWAITYYVSHRPYLYIISYKNKGLQKKVNVFIGAYEKVNN